MSRVAKVIILYDNYDLIKVNEVNRDRKTISIRRFVIEATCIFWNRSGQAVVLVWHGIILNQQKKNGATELKKELAMSLDRLLEEANSAAMGGTMPSPKFEAQKKNPQSRRSFAPLHIGIFRKFQQSCWLCLLQISHNLRCSKTNTSLFEQILMSFLAIPPAFEN